MRWLVFFGVVAGLAAQEMPGSGDWGAKTLQFKYLDPEQLREVFAGRSFVMRADRELKTLTVNGPAQFLAEVEQTGKQLDIPQEVAGDIELTVYMLASEASNGPAAKMPEDLQGLVKALVPTPATGLGLADMRTLRIADGQAGEMRLSAEPGGGAGLARIAFQSASSSSGPKATVRLIGLRVWLGQTTVQSSAAADSDVTTNLNLVNDQAVIAAQSGVRKPRIIILRAKVSR